MLVHLSLAFPKARHRRNFFPNERCHEADPRVQRAWMSSMSYRREPKHLVTEITPTAVILYQTPGLAYGFI